VDGTYGDRTATIDHFVKRYGTWPDPFAAVSFAKMTRCRTWLTRRIA